MRNTKIPWPNDEQELLEYIRSVMDIKSMTPEEAFEAGKRAAAGDTEDNDGWSGYQKSADAMWKAAAATFNYVAHKLGVTGFQAGYAAMQLLAENQGIECPFFIVKADKILYPQYNLSEWIQEQLNDSLPWAADKAREELKNHEQDSVHPDVWARWEYLASLPGVEEAKKNKK